MGVKAKIMGIVLFLVLLMASFLIWQVQAIYLDSLRKNLINNGLSLAAYVAVRSENPVLTNNIYSLHQLVTDTLENNEDVRYILITDTLGRPLVDTFGGGLPKGLLSFNSLTPGDSYNLRTFRNEEEVIHDIAAPILRGESGTVRIGLSEAGVGRAVASLERRLWLITLIISAVGLAVAYGLANILTFPLRVLVTATKKISGGDLNWRVPLDWAKDEFGRLGVSFNLMLGSIQEAYLESRRLSEARNSLLQKVLTAQEEERKRVARELHDQTAQVLTTLTLGLDTLQAESDPKELANKAIELKSTACQALEEIKTLSHRLRPSSLDDLGLGPAVERYVQDCSRHWGKEIGLYTAGLDDHLPGEIEIIAYRIIQEALNNVALHAQAENISVVIEKKEGRLLVTIEGDGIGFNPDLIIKSGPEAALGLIDMRERAELAGGTLRIDSTPGEGTTIYLRVPLPPDVKKDKD